MVGTLKLSRQFTGGRANCTEQCGYLTSWCRSQLPQPEGGVCQASRPAQWPPSLQPQNPSHTQNIYLEELKAVLSQQQPSQSGAASRTHESPIEPRHWSEARSVLLGNSSMLACSIAPGQGRLELGGPMSPKLRRARMRTLKSREPSCNNQICPGNASPNRHFSIIFSDNAEFLSIPTILFSENSTSC